MILTEKHKTDIAENDFTTIVYIYSDQEIAQILHIFDRTHKSIYFDKYETSNWDVLYHQDLTISVDKKVELDNPGLWTTKQNQFAVQLPIEILENTYTI